MNKILGYRKMAGLTQKAMAAVLNISEGQYRAKEKGRYPFNVDEIKKFHAELSEKGITVKVDEIFFENKPTQKDENEGA